MATPSSATPAVPAAPAAPPPRSAVKPIMVPYAGPGFDEDVITPKLHRKDLTPWIARRQNDPDFSKAVLCRVGIAMEFMKGRQLVEPVTEKVAEALWGLFRAEIVRDWSFCARTKLLTYSAPEQREDI